MAADQRHGLAVATLANINRDPKRRPDAYVPSDFIPWLAVERAVNAAELRTDPEEQSRLIKEKLFKR